MNKDLCYVIQPDDDTQDWKDIFAGIIAPAVETAGFARCQRGATMGAPGVAMDEIVKNLHEADLLLVDVTGCDQGHDATVLYQLGVRHALASHTILIAQHQSDIWRDFLAYRSIIYETGTYRAPADFQAKFLATVEAIDRDPHRPDNPVRHYLDRDLEVRDQVQALRKQIADLEARMAARGGEAVERAPQRIKFTPVQD